jgi:hypothetical protein
LSKRRISEQKRFKSEKRRFKVGKRVARTSEAGKRVDKEVGKKVGRTVGKKFRSGPKMHQSKQNRLKASKRRIKVDKNRFMVSKNCIKVSHHFREHCAANAFPLFLFLLLVHLCFCTLITI